MKDSDDLEDLKAKTEALNQASMKVGQAIYGQQQGGDAGAPPAAGEGGQAKLRPPSAGLHRCPQPFGAIHM